jgi:hypothetical protein
MDLNRLHTLREAQESDEAEPKSPVTVTTVISKQGSKTREDSTAAYSTGG